MIDFDFCAKTKIYFGKNKENEIGNILKEYSAHNVLIVIGKGSVKKSGLLDKVTSKLDEANIKYQIIEGVRANPTVDLVYEGIKIARNNNIDFLLPIGGGSVIDTAKAIAAGFYYDGDAFDFNLHKANPTKALPVGVILTISAAGSEMSNSCVIQNDELHIKSGFNSELNRPVFVIENPELTYTVDKYQTGCGIVDIMMHTLERYFQPSTDNELADGFALSLLRNVVKSGRIANENPCDYEARANLMLCSSLSHNGLTGIGKNFHMPVHQMEHALSGLYPSVAHGAGLSVLFPAWAEYYLDYDLDKFNTLSEFVFNSHIDDKRLNALTGIRLMREFFASLSMPIYFEDFKDENIDIELLTNKLTNNGERIIPHHKKPMDIEVARAIYNIANRRK